MARVDDYINARKIAADKLSEEPFDEIARRSGYRLIDKSRLKIPFLNRVYIVTWPGFEFEDGSTEKKEVPLQEQVLILHYLEFIIVFYYTLMLYFLKKVNILLGVFT